MDANPICPGGWHFAYPDFNLNGIGVAHTFARIDYPVRYYIIDFERSVRCQPDQPSLNHDLGNPRLSASFDLFRKDISTAGAVFSTEFKKVCT